jgi:hypothetical protein
MSNSAKKSAKSGKESKSKKIKAAERTIPRGRLIALEGTRGKDLYEEVERLARLCEEGGTNSAGWSRWDASNTFYEIRMGKAKQLSPPPRTLLLLYASDLMFRLRWEIEPALEEGRTVLAAPYVESAIAVGIAIGLSKEWLSELFSFAPKADAVLRLKEKGRKPKKKNDKPDSGFVEFCCNALASTSPEWDPAAIRAAAVAHLEEQEEIHVVGKKPPKELRKE